MAEQSDDLLARALRVLATAPTAAAGLSGLAALLVPAVADWCVADVLEPPDVVTRVVAVGRHGPLDLPPELGPVLARRSSARSGGGLLARLVEAPERRLLLDAAAVQELAGAADPRLRRQAELYLSLNSREVVVLGLTSSRELLGVLAVGRTERGFDPAELDRLADLALLAGTALAALRRHELQRGISAALQHSLLPALPVVPGLVVAARFTPAVEGLSVGGDWYDAFVLPGGPLALVVGDATGHDVRAAARMAELRNLLRAVAVDGRDAPAATLGRLDRVVDAVAPELSGTCVYAQLEDVGGSRRLLWSSAGHLPPVLLRDGAAHLLDTEPDLMLGVLTATARADHGRDLRDGDVLVLYTDGLVEQRRTGLDERLEVLRRLVETVGDVGAELLADRLVAELPSGEDDVAVLVVRLGPPPSAGRSTGPGASGRSPSGRSPSGRSPSGRSSSGQSST